MINMNLKNKNRNQVAKKTYELMTTPKKWIYSDIKLTKVQKQFKGIEVAQMIAL